MQRRMRPSLMNLAYLPRVVNSLLVRMCTVLSPSTALTTMPAPPAAEETRIIRSTTTSTIAPHPGSAPLPTTVAREPTDAELAAFALSKGFTLSPIGKFKKELVLSITSRMTARVGENVYQMAA